MITIKKRTYETRKSDQEVLTRIRLDVEPVATLVNPFAGNLTVDTNKPWVGRINSSEGTFKIVKTNSSILPLRLFEGNFFTIFIQGQMFSEQQRTRIDVRYKLNWHAALVFIFVYIFPITLSIKFINQDDWNSLRGLIFWFLVFDVIPTTLLLVQLNNLENKILELLGIEYTNLS